MKDYGRMEQAFSNIVEKQQVEWYEVFESDYYAEAMAEELGLSYEQLVDDQEFQEYSDMLAEEL
jgi:hypothetical protein